MINHYLQVQHTHQSHSKVSPSYPIPLHPHFPRIVFRGVAVEILHHTERELMCGVALGLDMTSTRQQPVVFYVLWNCWMIRTWRSFLGKMLPSRWVVVLYLLYSDVIDAHTFHRPSVIDLRFEGQYRCQC
jgi:hypothetical protein